jgi:hypothetical protein
LLAFDDQVATLEDEFRLLLLFFGLLLTLAFRA